MTIRWLNTHSGPQRKWMQAKILSNWCARLINPPTQGDFLCDCNKENLPSQFVLYAPSTSVLSTPLPSMQGITAFLHRWGKWMKLTWVIYGTLQPVKVSQHCRSQRAPSIFFTNTHKKNTHTQSVADYCTIWPHTKLCLTHINTGQLCYNPSLILLGRIHLFPKCTDHAYPCKPILVPLH